MATVYHRALAPPGLPQAGGKPTRNLLCIFVRHLCGKSGDSAGGPADAFNHLGVGYSLAINRPADRT